MGKILRRFRLTNGKQTPHFRFQPLNFKRGNIESPKQINLKIRLIEGWSNSMFFLFRIHVLKINVEKLGFDSGSYGCITMFTQIMFSYGFHYFKHISIPST